jgi:YggT family protein
MAELIRDSEEPRVVDEPRVVQHEVQTPTDRRDIMLTDTDDSHDVGLTKMQQLVYLLFGILNGLLVIRFVLVLFGANPLNTFASFIYDITNPFVAPFRGLFGYSSNTSAAHLEVETIVAVIVYSLLAYVVVRIIGLGKRHVETY